MSATEKPEDIIIAEIRRLGVADGVVEVILLEPECELLWKNLEQPVTFAELLRQVNEIPDWNGSVS